LRPHADGSGLRPRDSMNGCLLVDDEADHTIRGETRVQHVVHPRVDVEAFDDDIRRQRLVITDYQRLANPDRPHFAKTDLRGTAVREREYANSGEIDSDFFSMVDLCFSHPLHQTECLRLRGHAGYHVSSLQRSPEWYPAVL